MKKIVRFTESYKDEVIHFLKDNGFWGTKYYPKSFNPPHPVEDWNKIASLIELIVMGKEFPVFYVSDEMLLSGVHRLSAIELWAEMYDKDFVEVRQKIEQLSFDIHVWLEDLDDELKEAFFAYWEHESELAIEKIVDTARSQKDFEKNIKQVAVPLFDRGLI